MVTMKIKCFNCIKCNKEKKKVETNAVDLLYIPIFLLSEMSTKTGHSSSKWSCPHSYKPFANHQCVKTRSLPGFSTYASKLVQSETTPGVSNRENLIQEIDYKVWEGPRNREKR